MKTKQRFLFPLLMAIVMMAMSPMKMWADETPTLCDHSSTSGTCETCGCTVVTITTYTEMPGMVFQTSYTQGEATVEFTSKSGNPAGGNVTQTGPLNITVSTDYTIDRVDLQSTQATGGVLNLSPSSGTATVVTPTDKSISFYDINSAEVNINYTGETSSIINKIIVAYKESTLPSGSGSGDSGEGGGETQTTPALIVGTNSNLTLPVSSGYDVIATFTPSEPGIYKFVISPAMGLAIFVPNANQPFAYDMRSGEVTALNLVANQTYNIHIMNQTATTGSITITKVEGESGGETPTIPALIVGTNSNLTLPVSSGYDVIATFTPTAPGDYKFVISPAMGLAIFVPDNNQPLAFDLSSGEVTASGLVANQTYNIHIQNQNATTGSITITKVNGSDATYQTVQEGLANVNQITIPAGDGYKLVQFTAPATFRFQFKTSASDYMVYLYSGVPGESGTTCLVSDLGECQWDCTGDQTYYIALQKCLPINQSLSADEQIGLSILRAYQREMSYKWGTICLPFTIQYDPNNGNYKLYDLVGATSSELTFTEHSSGSVFGGRPLAVKAVGSKNAETGKYTINLVAKTKMFSDVTGGKYEVGDYTFKGTSVEMTNQTGIYFIAQNQFWWAKDAITVPAYRAYLEGPAPTNGAKSFNIVVDENGETTSIGELKAENLELRDGKFLENNRVIIVKNGKKFNLNGQEIK